MPLAVRCATQAGRAHRPGGQRLCLNGPAGGAASPVGARGDRRRVGAAARGGAADCTGAGGRAREASEAATSIARRATKGNRATLSVIALPWRTIAARAAAHQQRVAAHYRSIVRARCSCRSRSCVLHFVLDDARRRRHALTGAVAGRARQNWPRRSSTCQTAPTTPGRRPSPDNRRSTPSIPAGDKPDATHVRRLALLRHHHVFHVTAQAQDLSRTSRSARGPFAAAARPDQIVRVPRRCRSGSASRSSSTTSPAPTVCSAPTSSPGHRPTVNLPSSHQQHQRGAEVPDEAAAVQPGHGLRSGGASRSARCH